MRKIKMVADSSCDLFSLTHAELATAPMKIITDQREFADDEALDVGGMVEFLEGYKGRSKSSCPNPDDWLAAFGEADDIFCVTITSGLSGSYNSAGAAKQIYEAEHPGRRVFVMDSLSAGPEISLLLYRIEECIARGMEYEEICREVTAYGAHTGLLFVLKSLKNFANNGRVSPLLAKLCGIAGICIVGKASDAGTLEPVHKCRGEKKALEALLREMEKEGYRGGRVSIGHCRNEAAARELEARILEKYQTASVEIHKFRGLCSFYAEDGGVLCGFEKG